MKRQDSNKEMFKKRGLIFRRKNEHELLLLERKTLFGLIAISVLTLFIYFFGTDARHFVTNIVNPLPEHPAFDGTVYPIKQVPNWVKLNESERKASYDAIPQDKFIALPSYVPERLAVPYETLKWNDFLSDQIRNEKITYTVPYLGNYQIDNLENIGSHLAVDIKTPEGTPAYSIANGVVIKIGSGSGFGNHIVIQHNNMPSSDGSGRHETLYSSYSHLRQAVVSERTAVLKGQLIGYTGQTGFATTPHLHFQIDRDSAKWHPYWPFSTEEAKNAGLSFVQAVNAGLGKDKALANTLNPMKYVQQFLAGGPLIASTVTPQIPQASAPVQNDLIFKIDLPSHEFFEGEAIKPIIRLTDNSGNVVKKPKFQDRLKIELLNNSGKLNRQFLVAGYFLTGETKIIEIKNTKPGKEKIIIRFKGNEYASEEFEIKSKNTFSEINNAVIPQPQIPIQQFEKPFVPIIYTQEDKTRLNFPRIEIQTSKRTAAVGDTVEVMIQYFNENAKNAAPPAGMYFVNVFMGQGNLSRGLLKPEDFVDGIVKISFVPTHAGQAAIMLMGGNMLSGFSEAIEVINPAQAASTTQTIVQTADDSLLVFADIPQGSEYEEILRFLKKNSVVQGYPDNTFQPGREVQRAEALKMIFEALKENVSQEVSESLFPDLEPGAWYLPYVKKAYLESVVQGYPDGTFKPNVKVNMVEFYKMLFLASKTDINPEIIIQLPNGVKNDDWFAPYIQEAIQTNILELKEDPLKPGTPMTRGDIAKALYKLMLLKSA